MESRLHRQFGVPGIKHTFFLFLFSLFLPAVLWAFVDYICRSLSGVTLSFFVPEIKHTVSVTEWSYIVSLTYLKLNTLYFFVGGFVVFYGLSVSVHLVELHRHFGVPEIKRTV